MVKVPETLQFDVAPGAVIVVERHYHGWKGVVPPGYDILTPQPYSKRRDVPDPQPKGNISIGASQASSFFEAGGGVSLGSLNPEGKFTHTTALRFAQLDLPIQNFDQGDVDGLLKDGQLTLQEITENFVVRDPADPTGAKPLPGGGLDANYHVYIVEKVASASSITLLKNTAGGLSLSYNETAEACKPADALPAVPPASQPTPNTATTPVAPTDSPATPPAASTPATKPTGGTTSPAGTTPPSGPAAPGNTAPASAASNAAPVPKAKLHVCKNTDGSFTLSEDHPVPIGMVLTEVGLDPYTHRLAARGVRVDDVQLEPK